MTDFALNVPNALTTLGFALGTWWAVADGPSWAALASVALDEIDGRVARATGTSSSFGSQLDWTTDVLLTALTLRRLDAPWEAIPAVAAGQVALRDASWRPPVGSARAVLMIAAVLMDEGILDDPR